MHHAVLASIFASLVAAQGVLKASFTQYGSMDNNGSPTCNRTTVACGYWSAGYYAAISQNFYGGKTGTGAGYACEQCWRLTPQTDQNGQPLNGANPIVVKINDLCPVENNAPCSMQSQTDTNSYGANVNFDLCMDDGAAKALFPANGPFLALGQAQRVPCSQWLGQAPCYGNCTAFPAGPDSVSSTTPSPTSAPPSSQCTGGGAVATAYGQCGGQGWTGATCCPAGSSCQSQNQYYAQCVPGSSTIATSTKPASVGSGPSGTCSAPAPAYSQCGGQGWTGATCCQAGLTCQSQNQYYSQCLPPN